MEVIDLFAGCGGLSLGFVKAGYNITSAVEFDPVIAETYRLNHTNVNLLVEDIKNIDAEGTFQAGSADIILGGPPCQGFSMAGARIRQGFIDDPRNYLFKHYYNVVKAVKPKAFVMENVRGMMTMQDGKIFEEILNTFSNSENMDGVKYSLFYKVLKAIEFGIPQKRERLIIIGVRGENIDFESAWNETIDLIKKEYPHYFEKVTVRDAIGNLPSPTVDGVIRTPEVQSHYQEYLSSENNIITNHKKSNHSKVAIERMKKIRNGENYTDLDEKINSVHSGSYGRLCWDEQAATITTRFDTPAGGRFTHPEEDRTLTPREAARIQSFPDDFIFQGAKRDISRQIGNAVPPKISYFLAKYVDLLIQQCDERK